MCLCIASNLLMNFFLLQDFLVDWLKQNMSVVMDTSTVQLTSLGKVV